MNAKAICSVVGCGKLLHCKGVCTKHYERLKNHGDVHAGDSLTCAQCAKIFDGRPYARYCSASCRLKAHRQRQAEVCKKRYYEDPEYREKRRRLRQVCWDKNKSTYRAAENEKRKALRSQLRLCVVCADPIPLGSTSYRYCSLSCAAFAKKPKHGRKGALCAVCDRPSERRKKFCSDVCRKIKQKPKKKTLQQRQTARQSEKKRLSNSYVKECIVKHQKCRLPYALIPTDLVDAYRALLQLKRAIQERT